MLLTSVNLGQARKIEHAKPSGITGIFKQPVHTSVSITRNGLEGDTICDVKHHGGPDQAVYVYGGADYAWWAGELGYEVLPGSFGENLTISELESARFTIGDRLQVGAVILEVTAPRLPCVTLAARMGDPNFINRFRDGERPGLYCRVIREGPVQSGDLVSLEPYPGETVTILKMFRDYYQPDRSEATLRRYLAAPLAERARRDKEEQLHQLLNGK
jgi:MOSC domain-containing protein YiiM